MESPQLQRVGHDIGGQPTKATCPFHCWDTAAGWQAYHESVICYEKTMHSLGIQRWHEIFHSGSNRLRIVTSLGACESMAVYHKMLLSFEKEWSHPFFCTGNKGADHWGKSMTEAQVNYSGRSIMTFSDVG